MLRSSQYSDTDLLNCFIKDILGFPYLEAQEYKYVRKDVAK